MALSDTRRNPVVMSDPEWISSHELPAGAWDALADRVRAEPWLRPGWLRAWTAAFDEDRLVCLALSEDGRLRGLVALLLRGGAVVSPTNWHSPGFGVLAEDEIVRRALMTALLERTQRRLALSFLGETDARMLRECARGRRLVTRVVARQPFVEFGRETLSKNMRRSLRRGRRWLDEHGDVTLEIVAHERDLDRALEEGFDVESAGWKGRRRTAINSADATRSFYENVGRWAATRGMLRLFLLRVERRAISFEFVVRDGGCLYDLKGGYDEAFGKASPGALITNEILRYGARQGLARLELLGDSEHWKLRWATGMRDRHEVQVFGGGAVAAADWLVHAHARPLAREMRARVRE